MTKTVRDAAIVLGAISGYDKDNTSAKIEVRILKKIWEKH